MVRRIGHWAAVGLMYNLKMAPVSALSFESLIIDDEAPGSDFKLSMYLRAIERNKSYRITSITSLPMLPFQMIQQSRSCSRVLQRLCHENAHNLYNKETVKKFHRLLVASMLCYASALRDLHKAFWEVHDRRRQ